MNTAKFDCDIFIEQPLSDVFKYASDINNLPNWTACLNIIKSDDLPIYEGKKFEEIFKIGSKKQQAKSVISDFNEHDTTYTYKSSLNNLTIECVYIFKKVSDNKTKLTTIAKLTSSSPGLVFRFEMMSSKKQLKTNLDKLKKVLET